MFSTTVPAVATIPRPTILWSGLDVAKNTFDAAGWPALVGDRLWELKQLPCRQFPRTLDGARAFVEWLDSLGGGTPQPTRVVMEATGPYSEELAGWLVALRPSLGPAIVNPRRTHAFIESLGQRNKTDALDARALARYGFERRPAPHQSPDPAQAALRQLNRLRDDLVAMRVAEESRAGEPGLQPFIRKVHQDMIRSLNAQIEKVEKQMHQLVEKEQVLQRDVTALDAMAGVGFLTAATVLAELGDLRRFETARQLSAFAGMSPQRKESGTSVHVPARLCKQGSSRVRQALYLSAMAVIRGDNDLADRYGLLLQNGKTKMAALGMVMRRQLLLMRAILISGQPYQKHFTARGKTCGKPCAKTVEKGDV